MEHIFTNLGTKKVVDLIPYIKEKIAEKEAEKQPVKIYIGCDSQNDGSKTNYAGVIVLHYGNRGAHVLYTKMQVGRIRDGFARLWKEVEVSIEIAQYLQEQGIQKASFIDIDLNPDPIHGSNKVLRAALGYIESMGYVARCKPYALSATYAADKICK